jgi:hypothetical protein
MKTPLTAAAAIALVTASVCAASAYPVGSMVVPCAYPHGWNSTDASREVRGVPKGIDHRCVVSDRYDRFHPYATSDWSN